MKKTLMWVLAGFMCLSAIVYFPSLSSVIAVVFALIAAPIAPLQERFSRHGLRGWGKGLLLCALFAATAVTAPAQAPSGAASVRPTAPAASVLPETDPPLETAPPAVESSRFPETPAPTPEPSVEPSPAPTPAPTQAPPPASTPAQGQGGGGNGGNFDTWDNPGQQQTAMDWVLNTNSMKIHYPSCSSVPRIAPQNYATSNEPLDVLLSRGYTRCGRCF